MNTEEIIKCICGMDDNGNANAAITLSTANLNLDTDEIQNEKILSIHEPVINIESRHEFLQIDIVFRTYANPNLHSLWTSLEDYGESIDTQQGFGDTEPVATLTIVPLRLNGEYYAVAMSPILWVLQPNKPGKQANSIRMLFKMCDFSIYKTDQINVDDIKSDVDREISTNDYMQAIALKQEQEREEYTNKRNEMIEQFRRHY